MFVKKSYISPWGGVIIFGLLMVGLLVLAHRLASSPGWREVMDAGILFLSYGLLWLWLQKHSSTLVQDQAHRGKTTIIVIEPPLSPPNPHPFYLETTSAAAYEKVDLPEPGKWQYTLFSVN